MLLDAPSYDLNALEKYSINIVKCLTVEIIYVDLVHRFHAACLHLKKLVIIFPFSIFPSCVKSMNKI